jgi:hypothetical protein
MHRDISHPPTLYVVPCVLLSLMASAPVTQSRSHRTCTSTRVVSAGNRCHCYRHSTNCLCTRHNLRVQGVHFLQLVTITASLLHVALRPDSCSSSYLVLSRASYDVGHCDGLGDSASCLDLQHHM